MLKVIGGGEGRQPCSRLWEGVSRGVSHVQGDGGEGRQPCSR